MTEIQSISKNDRAIIWKTLRRQRILIKSIVGDPLGRRNSAVYQALQEYEKSIMKTEDKILLRKRAIIETINDELKTIARWNTPDIEV